MAPPSYEIVPSLVPCICKTFMGLLLQLRGSLSIAPARPDIAATTPSVEQANL